jgi:hypothetical protein
VHIEKARALAGEGALPFEAAVEGFASGAGGPGIQWVARDLKPPIFQQAAELFARGASVREVKQALGISHGEAGRLRLLAAAEGVLGSGRQDNERRRGNAAGRAFQVELKGRSSVPNHRGPGLGRDMSGDEGIWANGHQSRNTSDGEGYQH